MATYVGGAPNPVFMHREQVKSTAVITNADGAADAVYAYLPFGELLKEELSRLEENLGSADLELTPDDLRAIDSAASNIQVEGARHPMSHRALYTGKSTHTPPVSDR